MDTDSLCQIIFIIILLVLSAFFSSAETAFTTLNRIKVRTLADEGNKRAVVVNKIMENSRKMLSAILIGNNIVNISCSALVTSFTIKQFGDYYTGIAAGLLTIFLLIFGEITPKTMATIHSEKIAFAYAPVIKAIIIILTPVIFIIDVLSRIVMKIFHIDPSMAKKTITENELRTIVNVSHEEGVIELDERKIINNVFDFGDAEVKDVMIPRIDMAAVENNAKYEDVMQMFKQTMYSRLPVYKEDNSDDVIGILNIKDIIFAAKDKKFNIENIMRKPFYVYEHKNISELFNEMKQKSQSIAIVLDEYGVTVGMITTEDLIEEIVGEIRDEYDSDEIDDITQLENNVYRVLGSCKLDDLSERISVELQSEDNDSVGGYIIEKLDDFPKIGDRLNVDNLEFIIEKTQNNRVVSVILKIQNS